MQHVKNLLNTWHVRGFLPGAPNRSSRQEKIQWSLAVYKPRSCHWRKRLSKWIHVYNKEKVNIPGGEDFGAAHGLPQVTHRSVIWVALSGQLDVERINRQTQAQNGQKYARFSLPFRQRHDYFFLKGMFSLGSQNKCRVVHKCRTCCGVSQNFTIVTFARGNVWKDRFWLLIGWVGFGHCFRLDNLGPAVGAARGRLLWTKLLWVLPPVAVPWHCNRNLVQKSVCWNYFLFYFILFHLFWCIW